MHHTTKTSESVGRGVWERIFFKQIAIAILSLSLLQVAYYLIKCTST